MIDAREGLRQELPKILPPPEWIIKEASNNAKALELVKAKPFDIIITSQDAPAYADVQLLRYIRRINPHTRVIILTDESTPLDVLDAIGEDAFSYFCRPFSFAELEDVIRHAIEALAWDEGIEIVWASSEWVRLIVRCDLQSADRMLRFTHEVRIAATHLRLNNLENSPLRAIRDPARCAQVL